jgi:lysozyme family protein
MDVVLGYQGGPSVDPADPGAAAQFGITIGTLRESRHDKNLTIEDLKKLERDEAREIYRTRYWNVLRCDDLPVGVDLVVFDFGVNADPRQSAKMLQQVVGAAADGSIGDATIGAMKAMSPRDIVRDMSNRRMEFYRGLPQVPSALMNRTNAIEKAALEMIDSQRGFA